MAYYLRKENKKKGTYLQMYESHWDKEKKQPRSKSVMAFGTSSSLMRSPILSLTTQTLLQKKTKNVPPHSQRKPARVPLLPLWNITWDSFFFIRF